MCLLSLNYDVTKLLIIPFKTLLCRAKMRISISMAKRGKFFFYLLSFCYGWFNHFQKKNPEKRKDEMNPSRSRFYVKLFEVTFLLWAFFLFMYRRKHWMHALYGWIWGQFEFLSFLAFIHNAGSLGCRSEDAFLGKFNSPPVPRLTRKYEHNGRLDAVSS